MMYKNPLSIQTKIQYLKSGFENPVIRTVKIDHILRLWASSFELSACTNSASPHLSNRLPSIQSTQSEIRYLQSAIKHQKTENRCQKTYVRR